MTTTHLGQLAALATALCWAFNAMLFTHAGRRVGSDTVTHVRLWIALALLLPVHFVARGEWFPWEAGASRLVYLSLSGAVGFVLGDLFLFEALVLLGTSRALVVKTLAPALAAVMGWVLLGEALRPLHVLAMGVTLAGIVLVVRASERGGRGVEAVGHRHVAKGVFYAFLGALGQAVGVILSRYGLGDDFPPLSATLVRVAAGTATMLVVALAQGRVRHHVVSMRDRSAAAGIAGGTVLGPVVGVTLMLYSLQRAPVGIASTLMEMAPVFVLVVSAVFLRTRAHAAEWAGTGVAVTGAAMLFF